MKLLITGTDSSVGKTWVACALAGALRESGRTVVAIKPVETGCSDQASSREDGVRLARATGQRQPTHAIIRLPDSPAPVLASERAGSEIDFDALVLKIERFTDGSDVTLLEGVGGLLAPITWEWNIVDLARAIGASALVVAADRLGTINHTLLTLSALELAGVPSAGVVLTTAETSAGRGEVRQESAGTNAAAISRLSGIDRVLTLPLVTDEDAAAASITPVMEWLGQVGEKASSC